MHALKRWRADDESETCHVGMGRAEDRDDGFDTPIDEMSS